MNYHGEQLQDDRYPPVQPKKRKNKKKERIHELKKLWILLQNTPKNKHAN